MPGAGREIVCKESLLAKKREKTKCSMYFLLSQLISKLFLRENGANRKFLILCDRRAAKSQKLTFKC